MTEAADRYWSLAELAAYSGLSVQTLRRHVSAALNPLPHYRVGSRILVRRPDFDAWLERIGTPARMKKARALGEEVAAAVEDAYGPSRHDKDRIVGGRGNRHS